MTLVPVWSNLLTFRNLFQAHLALEKTVAILGIGKVDEVFLPISLAVDHRIIDGVKGADFLNFLAKKLAFEREGGEK